MAHHIKPFLTVHSRDPLSTRAPKFRWISLPTSPSPSLMSLLVLKHVSSLQLQGRGLHHSTYRESPLIRSSEDGPLLLVQGSESPPLRSS